ncbi:MAG TPA: M23 family metallopeptidase [Chitinophagaceae bacterium]|nr:M23 family metallopeptidase [Chitinophagaceae bacterium]
MIRATGAILLLLCTSCRIMLQNNSYLPGTGFDKTDDSPVYSLPFEKNKKVFVVQGYKSWFSHHDMIAIDFKVKKGTKICAARDGVVIATRKNSHRHGLKKEMLSEGNYVFIRHEDGSIAHYWHLNTGDVFIKKGDTVKTGQVIGLSGNTGFSAFPHLHFDVSGFDDNEKFTGLPTRFHTQQGDVYLLPGRFYRNTY